MATHIIVALIILIGIWVSRKPEIVVVLLVNPQMTLILLGQFLMCHLSQGRPHLLYF